MGAPEGASAGVSMYVSRRRAGGREACASGGGPPRGGACVRARARPQTGTVHECRAGKAKRDDRAWRVNEEGVRRWKLVSTHVHRAEDCAEISGAGRAGGEGECGGTGRVAEREGLCVSYAPGPTADESARGAGRRSAATRWRLWAAQYASTVSNARVHCARELMSSTMGATRPHGASGVPGDRLIRWCHSCMS